MRSRHCCRPDIFCTGDLISCRLTAAIVRIGGVCDVVPSDPTDTRVCAQLAASADMVSLAPPIEKTMGCLSIFRPLIARRATERVRNKLPPSLEPFHVVPLL